MVHITNSLLYVCDKPYVIFFERVLFKIFNSIYSEVVLLVKISGCNSSTLKKRSSHSFFSSCVSALITLFVIGCEYVQVLHFTSKIKVQVKQ